jgi:RNA polymerase subunit RPABC4/transcription elongation factor Spt4
MEKKPPKVKRTEFRACNGCGALTPTNTCPDCGKAVK